MLTSFVMESYDKAVTDEACLRIKTLTNTLHIRIILRSPTNEVTCRGDSELIDAIVDLKDKNDLSIRPLGQRRIIEFLLAPPFTEVAAKNASFSGRLPCHAIGTPFNKETTAVGLGHGLYIH